MLPFTLYFLNSLPPRMPPHYYVYTSMYIDIYREREVHYDIAIDIYKLLRVNI